MHSDKVLLTAGIIQEGRIHQFRNSKEGYYKEKPMDKLFNVDSPVFAFFARIMNMVILNLLWLVFCIPIFTIGASTTAMYSVQIQILQGMDDGIIRCFWKSFRQDFWKSTILSLLMVPLLGIVAFNVLYITGLVPGLPIVVKIGVGIVTVLLLSVIAYPFPLTAQFQNTIWGTLKNAFYFTFAFLPQSVWMLVVGALPMALLIILDIDVVRAMVLGTLVLVSLSANLKMRVLRRIFNKVASLEEICEQNKNEQ